MAHPGRRPKDPNLRIVEASHNVTRHGDKSAAEEAIQKQRSAFGRIAMPDTWGDKPEAVKAWERYIAPAWWLDATREMTAIAFCELVHEFRTDPKAFGASRHAQMRAYMSELGLTDERQRFGIGRDKTGDEFLD